MTTIAAVLNNLKKYRAPVGKPDLTLAAGRERQAGVLIALILDYSDDSVHVILTLRSSSLRTHSGDKMDESDESITSTALRETSEEINLPPSAIDVISIHKPAISMHKITVTPVCGVLSENIFFRELAESNQQNNSVTPDTLTSRVLSKLHANKAEVESIFTAPLLFFLKSRSHSVQVFFGINGEVTHKAHRFEYKDEYGRDFLIWGLTAYILVEVARIAFGRDPDFDTISADESTKA
ncbi:hypothetical protein BDR26DRAFT_865142, partial [Obelidium mucronatum]